MFREHDQVTVRECIKLGLVISLSYIGFYSIMGFIALVYG